MDWINTCHYKNPLTCSETGKFCDVGSSYINSFIEIHHLY